MRGNVSAKRKEKTFREISLHIKEGFNEKKRLSPSSSPPPSTTTITTITSTTVSSFFFLPLLNVRHDPFERLIQCSHWKASGNTSGKFPPEIDEESEEEFEYYDPEDEDEEDSQCLKRGHSDLERYVWTDVSTHNQVRPSKQRL